MTADPRIDYRNWDDRRCANSGCQRPLHGRVEFVLQISSGHLRWFCGVDCVVEGQQRYYDAIARETLLEMDREQCGVALNRPSHSRKDPA